MAKCKKKNEPTYILELSQYEAEVLADLLFSHLADRTGTLDGIGSALRGALGLEKDQPPARLRNMNKPGTYTVAEKRSSIYDTYNPLTYGLVPTPSIVTRYEHPHSVLEEIKPR